MEVGLSNESYERNRKSSYLVSALGVAGIAFAVFNFSGLPFFQNTDNFVLFAQEEIKLEQGVQVSGGDIGSNGKIDIEKDIINGNIFADIISIDKNTLINGNASFNKLKTKKETQILGTQTKPIQLPIVHLPEIPEFQVGTQDFKFEGTANTLIAGSYRNITLEKSSRLILTGGIYNLNKLELKENSMLIFNASTTLNIQFKLRGHDRVSILPGQNIKPDDLKINYLGIKPKGEKEEREDDDDEVNTLHDNQEKKDHKDRKIGRPVVFGKQSFLNFKLFAPNAKVIVGKETTFRGQTLARKIKIGKGGILSLDISGSIQPKLSDIILTEGERVVINQIVLQLITVGTLEDAQKIAASVNGIVTGIIPSINLYQILIETRTIAELDALIQRLLSQQNPKIKSVSKNVILNLIQ